jgi:hypothetical protein
MHILGNPQSEVMMDHSITMETQCFPAFLHPLGMDISILDALLVHQPKLTCNIKIVIFSDQEFISY